jgi:hypothetical protein
VQIIQDEERSFGEMLDRGIKYFNTIVAELEAQGAPKTIAADKVGTQAFIVLALKVGHRHVGVRSVSSRHPGLPACGCIWRLTWSLCRVIPPCARRPSTCTTRWASPST